MAGIQTAPRLTRREREIAQLIGLGYTNRAIGRELSIADRTVGTHVQNMLNKLGANNRAQIAAWSALESVATAPVRAEPRQAAQPAPRPTADQRRLGWVRGLLAALAVLVVGADDSVPTILASSAPRPTRGALIFEAKLKPDGEGFGTRYVLGDPSASEIRYLDGAVEFAVVKPGGNTGNNLGMEAMRRYYAEAQLSVIPGSNVEFWINLGSNGYATHIGDHVIDFETASELMQVQYLNLVDNKGGIPLGPQVSVTGMQAGRTFVIAAVVDPPRYTLYLDGREVVSLDHAPSAEFQQISFATFGEGGTVRLTAMRVFRLS
jgi:DNA-binding CsgD family transcriptional regulator